MAGDSRNSRPRRCQSGLSLVEVSLALMICGVAAVILWQFAAGHAQQQSRHQADGLLERARIAVMAHAFMHSELPCPAPDTGGLSSCSGSTEGYLPFVRLGLPPEAGKLGYSVSPLPPYLTGVPAGGFRVLMNPVPPTLTADPVAAEVLLKNLSSHSDHMLDFCASLAEPGLSSRMAFTVSYSGGHVPNIFGSGQSVSRLELMSFLHCAPLMAVAGRAHYNLQLAAGVMSKAIQDYRAQWEASYGLYQFDLGQGVWFMLSGIYASWRQWAVTSQAASAVHAQILSGTLPLQKAALYKAVQAQIAQIFYAVAMTSNVARFADNMTKADWTRIKNNVLVDNVIRLEKEITRNAVFSSTSVFFRSEQGRAPLADVALPDGPPHQISGPAARMIELAAGYASLVGVPVSMAAVDAGGTVPADESARQLIEEMKGCKTRTACDAVTASYTEQIRKDMDAARAPDAAGPETAMPESMAVPANIDRDVRTAYEALKDCSGKAACSAAGRKLEELIRDRAMARENGQDGSSQPDAADERIGQGAQQLGAELQACAQTRTCDNAAIQRQIELLVNGGGGN